MKETIRIKELKKDLFENVWFFAIAEGGAMGEPGAIMFIKNDGASYRCNYLDGDVSIKQIEKAFPILKKCNFGLFRIDSQVPDGWKYVNLGMGNHLIVNDDIYSRFTEKLGDYEDPSYVYGMWFRTAMQVIEEK